MKKSQWCGAVLIIIAVEIFIFGMSSVSPFGTFWESVVSVNKVLGGLILIVGLGTVGFVMLRDD